MYDVDSKHLVRNMYNVVDSAWQRKHVVRGKKSVVRGNSKKVWRMNRITPSATSSPRELTLGRSRGDTSKDSHIRRFAGDLQQPTRRVRRNAAPPASVAAPSARRPTTRPVSFASLHCQPRRVPSPGDTHTARHDRRAMTWPPIFHHDLVLHDHPCAGHPRAPRRRWLHRRVLWYARKQ